MDNSETGVRENHLSALYKALDEGNVAEVERIQSILTRDEEYVACSYLLNREGPSSKKLAMHLNKDGFLVKEHLEEKKGGAFIFIWRYLFFGLIFVGVFLTEYILKMFLGIGIYGGAFFSLFEVVVLSLVAIGVILFVEENYLG